MLAVAVSDAADEDAGDDERAVQADGADGVIEDAVVGPLGEGFCLRFREAKIDFGAEHLVDSEVAVGGQEFLRAEEAQRVLKIAGHGVLSAFSAVEREHGDARAKAAGIQREHAAVFVVRMRNDEHERGPGVELAEDLLQAQRTLIDGQLAAVARAGALAAEVCGISEGGGLGRQAAGRQSKKQKNASTRDISKYTHESSCAL